MYNAVWSPMCCSPICFIYKQGGFNAKGPLVCTIAKETAFFIFTVSQMF